MGTVNRMQSGESCLVISLLLLLLGGHTKGDGKFWWMGSGAFQGDTSGGNGGYGGGNDDGGYSDDENNVNTGNNFQSNPGFTLPATQGLASSNLQASSWPPVTQLPFSDCSGRTSNCWSAGQPDVDCIDDAACCFDGCANVCQGAGSRSPVSPPAPVQQIIQASPAQSQQNVQQQYPQKTVSVQQQYPQKTVSVQQQYPKKTNNVQKQHRKKTVKVKQQQHKKQVQVQQQYPQKTVQLQQQPVRQVIPASSKPFIQCPAAMKCVPKINCDLLGVMRNQDLIFTPQQEMLRVQLITCINSDAGNRVDVCCRDPNYKDPWPNMNMNNQNQQGQGVNTGVNQGISPRGGHKKKQNKKTNKKNGEYSWMNKEKNMFG